MANNPKSVVILDEDTMRRAIARICYEIIERNEGLDNLVLVGIRTRGAHLAKRMGEFLSAIENVKVPVAELDITAYRDDAKNAGEQGWALCGGEDLPETLANRTVVLVDDVLYTGRTIRAALDALIDCGRPARILLAVLVDRGHRELPIRADFIGKNLPTSKGEKIAVQVHEVDGTDAVTICKEN